MLLLRWVCILAGPQVGVAADGSGGGVVGVGGGAGGAGSGNGLVGKSKSKSSRVQGLPAVLWAMVGWGRGVGGAEGSRSGGAVVVSRGGALGWTFEVCPGSGGGRWGCCGVGWWWCGSGCVGGGE